MDYKEEPIIEEELDDGEIVQEEPIDQIIDYTNETTSQRSSLLRRLIVVFSMAMLYFVLRIFDANAVFNPVNADIFIILGIIVVIISITTMIVLFNLAPSVYHLETTLKKVKRYNELLDFLSIIPILMVIFTLANMFFVSFSPISGTSMEPNFHDNEAVLFEHLGDEYKRFDVVIVYVEELNDPYLIKRVIGLPGENVVIEDNEIYINGVLLIQDFIDQDQVRTYCLGSPNINYCTFDIPENSYFVLGDNRDGQAVTDQPSGYSIDSRTFGPVHTDHIYGRVILTFKDYNLLNQE